MNTYNKPISNGTDSLTEYFRRVLKRLIVSLVSFITLCSCESHSNVNFDQSSTTDSIPSLVPTSLAEQVYFYAPEFDTLTCEASGACDCCTGKFIFLNDSQFIWIDECMSDASYSKGLYRFEKGNLVITTDSICVSREYNWEKETDTTGKFLVDYIITDTLVSRSTQTLKRIMCKSKLCFILSDKETYYLSPVESAQPSEFINNMKKDGIWKRLNVKTYD